MRNLILLLIIGGGVYWAYTLWTSTSVTPEYPAEESSVTDRDPAYEPEFPDDRSKSADAAMQPPVEDPVEQPLSDLDNEILIVREEIARNNSMGNRLRLSALLLETNDPAAIGEARSNLKSIVTTAPESTVAGEARYLLLGEVTGNELNALAHEIFQRGPGSPGFGLAAEVCADQVGIADSGAALQSWDLLTEAYLGAKDLETKALIRAKLWTLVDRWVFSSKPFPEVCTFDTVVSGDSLSVIAQRNKTSVDALMHLNQLKSHVIHPGQKLKVLSGKVRIEVDKSDFRLDVYLGNRWLMGFPIGHGRIEKPTPAGDYTIGVCQKQPMWQPRDGRAPIAYGGEGNPLGERWIGFVDGASFGLGIHGTDDPDSIGTLCSEGCVRLRNTDVITLYPWVLKGTKVTIQE